MAYITEDGQIIDNSYSTLADQQEANIDRQATIGLDYPNSSLGDVPENFGYDERALQEYLNSWQNGLVDSQAGDPGLRINLPDVNNYDFGNDPDALNNFLRDYQAAYEEGDGQPVSGSSSGLGSLVRNALSGSTGRGLMSALQMAGTLAPLFGSQYRGPVDSRGNPVQLTSIDKFVPSGSYNPVNLGYGQSSEYRPTRWTPGELAATRDFFSGNPNPDAIYNKAIEGRLSANQLADAWAQATGGDYQSALSATNQYLTQNSKSLPGGYVPPGDPGSVSQSRPTSTPSIRTKYARGGGVFDLPAARDLPGGLLPISGRMVELLSATGGQDDQVDISASPGEYIFDADVVSALGDGNTEAGVKKLDEMRNRIRQHKRSASSHDIPPKALPIERYLENT